jgi:short-subunit dehydrogenase involved in D-alanine esterification of teichoic acids
MGGNDVNSVKTDPLSTAPHEKKAEILADNWSERSAYIRDLQYKTAIRAIERSKDIITIETASDLKAAVHVARQATGLLDAEAPAISLNLSGGGGFFEAAGPVYEATSEPVEPVTLEGCGV